MLISLIIYAIATAVGLRYATPWLTSGSVAFAPREKNQFLWGTLTVVGITAIYAVLSIVLNAGAQLFALALISAIGRSMLTGVIYELTFMVVDVLFLALSIWGVTKVMKNSLTVKSFGATVSASVIITAVAIIGQLTLGIVMLNLAQ